MTSMYSRKIKVEDTFDLVRAGKFIFDFRRMTLQKLSWDEYSIISQWRLKETNEGLCVMVEGEKTYYPIAIDKLGQDEEFLKKVMDAYAGYIFERDILASPR